MTRSQAWFFLALRAIPSAGLLALAPCLVAQTSSSGIRPGSTARSTTGATSGATARPSGGTSSSSGGARQYKSNTLLGDATVMIDPETRSLIIVTDEQTHLEIDKVIKNLDQPKPQVLIKVVFVEVTYNNSSDVGVEGTYTIHLGAHANPAISRTGSNTTTTASPTGTSQTVTATTSSETLAATLANTLAAGTSFPGASTTGALLNLMGNNFSAAINALSTKGKVEILSRPSIMARNNQEAVIVVGSEVPFVTNSRVTEAGQTINTIQYDNIGIILRVTPFITSEGNVEMIVAPEISALTDQTVAISNNATAPVISKRSAETVVVTPNGQTIVIGGMMQTQRTSSVDKVPVLGDIPYVGYAFRHTVKSDVKSELMVFLTPYIVDSRPKLDNVTESEFHRTEIMQKSFPRSELQRDMDVDPAATSVPDTKAVRRARPAGSPPPMKAEDWNQLDLPAK